MLFYLQQYYLWRIRATTQVLGCFWRLHEVDRLPVSSEWLNHFYQCIAFVLLLNIPGLNMGSGYCFYMANQHYRNIGTSSIGFISIRFWQAYKAQELSLSDLPYQQPFYPLLPIGVIVLGIVMCITAGYFAVIQKPFNFRVSIAILFFKDSFFFWKTHIHFLEHSYDICHHSALYCFILWVYNIREVFYTLVWCQLCVRCCMGTWARRPDTSTRSGGIEK